MTNYEPKIIVFCCNWCSYAGADLTSTPELKKHSNCRIIRTMCSGRIEPAFISEAFIKGADGVMIAGCPPGDCHYNSGNYKAKRRLLLLKSVLNQLGIEPERLRMDLIPTTDLPKFQSSLTDFISAVSKLCPLALDKAESKKVRVK
ncbi:hydrogenase iron-sulfur subunit [Chloroflexota bacterium]